MLTFYEIRSLVSSSRVSAGTVGDIDAHFYRIFIAT